MSYFGIENNNQKITEYTIEERKKEKKEEKEETKEPKFTKKSELVNDDN